ncbi:MAG: trypsin-like peptidase domain-containing protein [Clostridia bacterium]|nr:trypsin-like peptidase domain-containing protein [Clostridia bacterium]
MTEDFENNTMNNEEITASEEAAVEEIVAEETESIAEEVVAEAEKDEAEIEIQSEPVDISSGPSLFADEEEAEAPEVEPEKVEAAPQAEPPVYAPQPNPNAYNQPNGYQRGYYSQQAYGAYNYGYQQPQAQPMPVAPAEAPKAKKNGKKIFLSAIALILVFALGVGFAQVLPKNKKSTYTNETTTGSSDEEYKGDDAQLEINNTPSASTSNGSILTPSQVYEKVKKSNVGIVVYSGSSNRSAGEGSGIVMGLDTTGEYTYIITCAHVIKDAGIKVKVQTEDGTSFDAQIVGYDQRTDVGVVKVKSTGFTPAEFGDSTALKIGDPVYAVGNPGGVEFFGSFTGGHVSSMNRPVSSEIGYTMKCIQHDASINPGNSGGMLVNQYGQVIGINSQKIASSSYEGMGFAIPITSAKEIVDALIKNGYVPNRPMLGITYAPVSASTQYYMIAQAKGLPAGTLIITEIKSGSSLAGTGARQYDMIVAVNGKSLDTADVLLSLIDGGKVGDKLKLTLCRVNSNYSVDEFDIEVTLVEDKGSSTQETTTERAVNPFDYWGY